MKKRKSKSLLLNKRSISNLQKHQLKGGTIFTLTVCTLEQIISVEVCPDPVDPVAPVDPDPGSGDTGGGSDETTIYFTYSISVCTVH
jgi:hypothetical protein